VGGATLSESRMLEFQSGGTTRLICGDPQFARDVAMFSADSSCAAISHGPLLRSGSRGARGNHGHNPRTDGMPLNGSHGGQGDRDHDSRTVGAPHSGSRGVEAIVTTIPEPSERRTYGMCGALHFCAAEPMGCAGYSVSMPSSAD
jgi:hypothetical protein